MIKLVKSKIFIICIAAIILAAGCAQSSPELKNDEAPTPAVAAPTADVTTPQPTAEPTATPRPIVTPTAVPQIPEHIQKFILKNTDTIGYIKIEDTLIDYPVMYSGDNEYYLNYDFDRQKSYYGAIFMDFRCDPYDFDKTRNIIIYGHRMRDGTMFRNLTNFFGEDFFYSHRIVHFDTLRGEMDWEVFSVFESHIDFYYINTEWESDEQWLLFMQYCQQLSLFETDVNLDEDDIVLTLSTCALDPDHRVVVMARLIQEDEEAVDDES